MLGTTIDLIDMYHKGTGCCNREERLPEDAKAVSLSSNADFYAVQTYFKEYFKRKLERVTFHMTDCEIYRPFSSFPHTIIMQKSFLN